MVYVLLGASILFACSNNLILHILSSKGIKSNPFLFNVFVSLLWVVVLLIYNLGVKGFTWSTLMYGAIYGVVLSGLLLSKIIAISKGPVSTATLVGASSFILTTIFNVIYWKESVGVFEIIGIILMAGAVFMMTYKKSSKENNGRISPIYIISLALELISGALVGIVFRFHQSSADKANASEMLMVAGAASALFSLIIWACTKKKINVSFDWKGSSVKDRWIYVIVILAAGITSCLYCRLNIYLVGALPSSIFFPTFNGLDIALVTIFGIIIFKEKLNWMSVVGVVLGVVAVLFVSHFFGAVAI